MTPVLAEVPTNERAQSEIVITTAQIELIRKTIAKDATPDELQLFFFDCQRQGVHPLDRLIHFTKRDNKYTPITSIDFMRQQAAATGEYLGCTKPIWTGTPGKPGFKVEMVARRMVKGHIAEHYGEVWWEEYYPGEKQGFMWRKMSHVMLAKVCEVVCLRKGFPKELAGLYAKEEMDQAGSSNGITPHVEGFAPNEWCKGALSSYEAKDGVKPHTFHFATIDGPLFKCSTHRLPISEALIVALLGKDVEYKFAKKGNFYELIGLQPATMVEPLQDLISRGTSDQTTLEVTHPDSGSDLDAVPDHDWLTGTIKAYGQKSGENKSGPWTRHAIDFLDEQGVPYKTSTFSLSLLSADTEWCEENIEHAIEQEMPVIFEFEDDGKYKTLTVLRLAP